MSGNERSAPALPPRKHNEYDTRFGRVRVFLRDGKRTLGLFCPACGQFGGLDQDQANGRISVDHASMGCPGGYHETHNFVAELPAEERDLFALDEGMVQ